LSYNLFQDNEVPLKQRSILSNIGTSEFMCNLTKSWWLISSGSLQVNAIIDGVIDNELEIIESTALGV